MKIKFLGGTRGVTGSNYLVETENEKFLVDCGMFQGSKEVEDKNGQPFGYEPDGIDFVILTHAHIDHSGRLPKLVKEGFKGNIYMTQPSLDLADLMLRDSANIQENDIYFENKKRKRAARPLLKPLYDKDDVERTVRLMVACHYDSIVEVSPNIRVRFRDAGHILGSAILEIWIREGGKVSKVVFSGDLGMKGRPIIEDPSFIDGCDYLIMESTYGGTVHDDMEKNLDKLIEIINMVAFRGGSVIIPAFAIGRTQEIIYDLNRHYEKNRDPSSAVPVYIDSPLATSATKVFMKNSYVFNEEARDRIINGDNIFDFPNLKYTSSVEESKMLNKVQFPRVIISASGMATAGRVRHHLKHNLWDERSAICFVGYQAEGTLGRLLLDGKKKVKVLGEEIAVKADIYSLDGFSGHADEPMLLEWVDKMKDRPKKIFLTHGELDQADPLKKVLEEKMGYVVTIPKEGEEYSLAPVEYAEKVKIPEIDGFDFEHKLKDLSIRLKDIEDRASKNEDIKLSRKKEEDLGKILKNIDSSLMDLSMLLGK